MPMPHPDKRIVQTAAAIQQYVLDHPGCADTAMGVHQWWLNGTEDEDAMALTAEALAYLEEAGVLQQVPMRRQPVWRARQA